jgi:hypothetical protein
MSRKIAMPKVRMEDVKIPPRREIAEEDTHVGAGTDRAKEKRVRAMTLVERMHRAGTLTFSQWQAAGALRNRILLEIGPSQGVSSYGANPGGSNRYTKADRRAVAILKNRSNLSRLADLLFSMCGMHDEEGTKVLDTKLAEKLIEACLSTVNPPTQAELGGAFTAYAGAKQSAAAAGALIAHLLSRAAVHLRYERLPEFTDFSARRLAVDASSDIQ